jgi:hypothetical protein
MYVIHKSSRAPDPLGSYSGSTWDKAGIRQLYRPFYYIRAGAQAIADQLTAANPVGFQVSKV